MQIILKKNKKIKKNVCSSCVCKKKAVILHPICKVRLSNRNFKQ